MEKEVEVSNRGLVLDLPELTLINFLEIPLLKYEHHTDIPVLLGETVKALAVQPGGRYIDCI